MRQGLVAVGISLFISFAAFAQTDRGSITGTITDSTGAVVPNAPVEITNQATGAIYKGGASATGNFIVANLPAGHYTLTVTVNGFKKYVRRAGLNPKVSPHTRRHAFITAALDTGVPLRDVQDAAFHADPRTTMRYDRARTSLDRHATYIVAAYVARAAR